MPTIVIPATAIPGQTVTVDGSGFTPKAKFALSTVDAAGTEVGKTSNTNRPRPDGTFRVGINVPTLVGPSKVRAYQSGVLVAEASILVALAAPALKVSAVTASNPTQAGVTISWTVSAPATGQVEYGLTTAYGLVSTPETSFKYTSHVQILSGLTPGTLYHFRVRSQDAAGNVAVSADQSFSTLAAVTPPPPGIYPPDTTLVYLATPALSLPPYLTEFTDPTWGTKVRRISNVNMYRNAYPKQSTWNLDGTRIFLGYGFRMLDGATYADLGQKATGVEYPFWSNTDPNVMYGCSDNQPYLKRWNAATNAWTVVATFSNVVHVALGNYEGNLSLDDRRIALIYRDASGTWGVLVADPVAGTEIARLPIGAMPDNCNISLSGGWVSIQHAVNGSGPNQGTRMYAISGNSLVDLFSMESGRSHGDMMRDAAGNDVYMAITPKRVFRCDTGTSVVCLPPGYQVGHVSGRAHSRPGWAYYSCTDSSTNVGNDQIFAMKLDGSMTAEVFTFARGTGVGYDDSPFAVPNRDGTKVIWGTPNGGSGTFAYVVGMRT